MRHFCSVAEGIDPVHTSEDRLTDRGNSELSFSTCDASVVGIKLNFQTYSGTQKTNSNQSVTMPLINIYF